MSHFYPNPILAKKPETKGMLLAIDTCGGD